MSQNQEKKIVKSEGGFFNELMVRTSSSYA